ncbi:MAG: deoxyribonuclease V [Gammaproteobacteria bacterium]|nr:deoxyribonuclease V [Gammaproteobacteria bacterium]MCW8959094.1 deoxyribonuclease V [Gammaproteobacteria bacterium]MCW8972868.1 deoxyribonuclease V [Gammaproteobacteria bacterium]MCW8993205.1 deoxyribonuclease V [Gammaproteobacteria bacterium]
METTVQLHHSHPWDLSPKEAIALQRQLRAHLRIEDDLGEVRTVAGVDVGFEQNNTITRAAVAVLDYPSLQLRESAIARQPTRFPYIPGLLSFREIPAVLEALEQLSELPDLLLCDGQGIAHPRRLGIASHLGLLIDRPTIGVGKSRLIGTHDEPGREKGQWVPLSDKGEVIGCVLRTRTGVKPLYISPGHRMGLDSAREWVVRCLTRYRLPETTRWAHRLASG